jgi:hypothetical protein
MQIFSANKADMQNPAEDPSVNKIDTMSEEIFESGQSPDSQETISDYSLLPDIDDNETSKNLLPDKLQTSTGFFWKSGFSRFQVLSGIKRVGLLFF